MVAQIYFSGDECNVSCSGARVMQQISHTRQCSCKIVGNYRLKLIPGLVPSTNGPIVHKYTTFLVHVNDYILQSIQIAIGDL